MQTHLKELVVFMASPGDLPDEREVIRKTEDELNYLFASYGIRLRVVGWELLAPGYGRPQAQINPLVHECDVFIGLLNKRWGSNTGEYSSGFEEEFEIALGRRRQGGENPAIGMFFAEIGPEFLHDVGPQLSKVIEFKNRVQSERIALYGEFKNPEHLGKLVYSFLMASVLPLVAAKDSSAAGHEVSGTPSQGARELETHSVKTREQSTPTNEAARQVSETLQRFASALSGHGDGKLDFERLAIFARAFEPNSEPLSAHLVNRLYRRFTELSLTEAEGDIWLRTFFRDVGQADSIADRTVPGWALLHVEKDSAQLDQKLVAFAQHDDAYTARGALRILTRLGRRPEEVWSLGLTSSGPESKPLSVQTWIRVFDVLPGVDTGFDYLISQLGDNDLQLIEALCQDPELNASSKEALTGLMDSISGDFTALGRKAPSPYTRNAEALTDFLTENIERIPAEDLARMARQATTKLRRAAIKRLLTNGQVEGSLLRDVLSWSDGPTTNMVIEKALASPTFGEVALAVITNNSSKATFSTDLETKLLASVRTTGELRAIYESSPINHRAWAALAISSGQDMLGDSRRMIDSDAADFRMKVGTVAEEYSSAIDFVAENLRAAACALIGEVGEGMEDEIRLAKEVGMGELVSPRPALIALSKIADPTHFSAIREALPSIDDYTFVQDTEQLMSSALAPLLADIWKTAEVPALREASERWLVQQPDRSDEQLEEALYDHSVSVRIAALEAIVARKSKEQLAQLLRKYPSGDRRHWYNVVAGLDEVLYSPKS